MEALTGWLEKGGPVMWPLLGLSVLALMVILERALFWMREARRRPEEVLRKELDGRPSGESRAQLESALELRIGDEQRRLERGMVWLDTVITSAPMLGILGTVLGIIDSFELLAARSDVDPLAVSGGVSEALITTASGLVIALLVIFPYNVFRARLRMRLESLERAALGILAEAD